MTAALLTAAAVLLAWRPPRSARLLCRLEIAPPGRVARRPVSLGTDSGMRTAVACFGGLGLAAVVGGAVGLVAGAAAVAVADRVLRGLPTRAEQERQRAVERDLPLCLDLLAACLCAGAPPAVALTEVSGALPGPLGADLAVVAGAASLGAPALECWASWPRGAPSVVRPVAAAFARAEATGAALGPLLDAIAGDLRHAARARGEAAARRAGVLAVAPLGLCFLPAFVLLGVVPLVAGLVVGVLP